MKKEETVMGLYAMRLQGKNRVAQERNNTVNRAVELINQLDELEQTDIGVGLSKPVIPKFAADYIEQSKKDNDSINQVFAFMDDKEDKDLWHWLFPSMYEEKRANQEVFMRAWLDGFTIASEDKQEVEENFYTFDNAKKWLHDNGFVVFEKDKLDEEVQRMIDKTYKEMNEKPVIPQFVADWIERQKQPDWDYENKENALADSIHFTLYSLEANYPETNHDVVLRKPINEWLDDDRKNYWKLIDGVRYGYEVEKEKLYRFSAGNRYVRFNLDGSIIGVKKGNSVVCLERLSKLPFDYQKAIESGIITLEEVTE